MVTAKVGRQTLADVVFGNHGAGVGSWRRELTSPGPDPENTQTQFIKNQGRAEEKKVIRIKN